MTGPRLTAETSCATDLPHIEADTHAIACQFCQPDPAATARAARAWDEGYVASATDAVSGVITPNPYRQP